MSEQKLPFDEDIQSSIIQIMMTNEAFTIKCEQHLRSEYFSDRYHSWLFETIIKYYQKYKLLPNPAVIRTEIMKFADNERSLYGTVLNKVMSVEVNSNIDYIREQLTAFAKLMFFVQSIKTIDGIYKSSKIDAVDMIHDVSDRLAAIKFSDDELFDYNKLEDVLAEARNTAHHRLPMGITHIDEEIMGGVPRGRVMCFLGAGNSGKTMILINITRNFIERGKKVLFINLENILDQFMARLLSSISRIPYNRFYRVLTPEEEIEKSKAHRLMRDRLLIKNWFDYGILAEDMVSYCKRLKMEQDYDAIVIDYAQLLKIRNSSKMAVHTYMQEVANILAAMARQLNVPVITAVQGNRDAQRKSRSAKQYSELLRMTDIADCFAFTRPMDMVITLTNSDYDAGQNVVKLLLDKNRDGKTGIAVEAEIDFSRCRMFDENLRCSRYLTKADHADSDETD